MTANVGDKRLIWFEVIKVRPNNTGNNDDDIVELRPETDLKNTIIVSQKELERIRYDN